MIIGVGGGLGSGKTQFIVILGKSDSDNEKRILSNFKTEFSEMINPLDLMLSNTRLDNSTILLTETHTFFDSRLSGTLANRLQGYFFLQTRKKGVDLYYDAQLLDAVDKRLRYIADYTVYCENIKKKKVFKYIIFETDIPKKVLYLPYRKAKEYWKLYNSFEIVSPILSQQLPLEEALAVFKDAPNKRSFAVMLRNDYPYLTFDTCTTIYSLIKAKKIERVKKLLGQDYHENN